jgi:hypothetical protein
LVKNKKVKLNYVPGNGAWTYHVVVPGTKKLDGSWGYTKVSGTIDDFKITAKNLWPRKNADMWMSVNAEIRKAIGKIGGDTVVLTLDLVT